ncbi:MAG TPA: CHRD domain-containing protein [Vicinamibacterales bacterium]|nr:CHRD domain-containing protein [Vicinamibacterales bacterium]
MRRSYILLAACIGLLAFAASGTAQSTERFKIRLTTVPMDAGMRNNVAGAGTGTATLAGNKLTVDAAFDGLKSPATAAAVHSGRARGVRGESIGVLEVTKSTKGTVSGAINLTDAQLKALRDGHLYIEVASEKAPEGNLWGWILK